MLDSIIADRIAQREDDAENRARLMGVMAVLALPMLRTIDGHERRRRVEVEISEGRWAEVHGVEVSADTLVFFFGANGSRVEYTFRVSEGCPPWRVDAARDAALPGFAEPG